MVGTQETNNDDDVAGLDETPQGACSGAAVWPSGADDHVWISAEAVKAVTPHHCSKRYWQRMLVRMAMMIDVQSIIMCLSLSSASLSFDREASQAPIQAGHVTTGYSTPFPLLVPHPESCSIWSFLEISLPISLNCINVSKFGPAESPCFPSSYMSFMGSTTS